MNTSKHESGEIVGRLLSHRGGSPNQPRHRRFFRFNPSLGAEALAKEATLKRSPGHRTKVP